MQPRQMRETSRPVRPSLVYSIALSEPVSVSCEVRHDIGCEEFVCLNVVSVIAVDQQVHTGVVILADPIDGLRHRADNPPHGPAPPPPLPLRPHSGVVAA